MHGAPWHRTLPVQPPRFSAPAPAAKWTIVRGTKTNPEAVVYQLEPDKPGGSLSCVKADDNILFFLDKERNLMVGNGDFSYTLNRSDKALNN